MACYALSIRLWYTFAPQRPVCHCCIISTSILSLTHFCCHDSYITFTHVAIACYGGVWTWWLWRLAAKNAYNKARRMGMKQGKSWENNNNTKSAEAEIPGSLAVLKVLMGEGFAAAWSRQKCNQSLWEKYLQQHEVGKNATREEERGSWRRRKRQKFQANWWCCMGEGFAAAWSPQNCN